MIEAKFLTEQERRELRSLLKRSRGESLALRRANMLLLLDDGWSLGEVSKALYLEIFTVNSVYKRFQADGMSSLSALDITGRPIKLDKTQIAALVLHLETAHYSTSQEIREYIEANFLIKYSRSGILSLLKKIGFVHEKTVITAAFPSKLVQEEAIAKYEALKLGLKNEVIVHIDGVHPTHMAKTGKIWVKKGEKRHILSNTGRGRLNIHGAINIATGQFTFMENRTIDAISTVQLFEKLQKAYPSETKIHIFLDNAKYHHSKIVQEWLEKPDNRIKLQFLPAYCPHLNPIERLWHVMHKHVTRNKYYKSYNDFAKAILSFFKETIPAKWDDIKSYVTDNFEVKSNEKFKFI